MSKPGMTDRNMTDQSIIEVQRFIKKIYVNRPFKGEFRALVESYLNGGDWLFSVKDILRLLKSNHGLGIIDGTYSVCAESLALFIASVAMCQDHQYTYAAFKDTLANATILEPLFRSFLGAKPEYLLQRAIESIETALSQVKDHSLFLPGWDANLETAAWALLICSHNAQMIAKALELQKTKAEKAARPKVRKIKVTTDPIEPSVPPKAFYDQFHKTLGSTGE